MNKEQIKKRIEEEMRKHKERLGENWIDLASRKIAKEFQEEIIWLENKAHLHKQQMFGQQPSIKEADLVSIIQKLKNQNG